MLKSYLHAISLIERMHRQFLDVVKSELDGQRIRDINNVQALILFNIGMDELTVGELTQRGYYLGSNVSYNVKKMVEHGYLQQERSEHDRRSVRVSLSDKGKKLWDRMDQMFKRHEAMLADSPITEDKVDAATSALSELERFWMHAAQSAPRAPEPLIGKAVDRRDAAAYFGD